MLIVLNPIFEADLLLEQYGFHPNVDAKCQYGVYVFMSRNIIHWKWWTEYFTNIAHGGSMKCITRPIADKQVLQMIKCWLAVVVIEDGRHDKLRRT